MAINATNYDGTKDYKIAEVGDVCHPNLFTNGDFQINQRGKSQYTLSGPSVDMWVTALSSNVLMTVTDEGLKFTNIGTSLSYFGTNVLEKDVEGSYVTLCLGVNGNRYTHTINLSSVPIDWVTLSDFLKFNVTEKISGSSKFYNFTFSISKDCTFNYADLFEGSIAYQHVKEDYVIALTRCKRYIERYKHLVPFNGTFYIAGFKYDVPKLTTPTATFVEVSDNSGIVNGTFTGAVVTTDSIGYIYYNGGSAASLGNRTFSMIVLISCEPL